MDMIHQLAKVFIPVAIFFVWVIRYDNIVKEFKQFDLPNWLRDLVGILKLSFALMIAGSNEPLVKLGAIGIAVLMVAALITHLKVKNPPQKMLPASVLLALSLIIFFGAQS
jgi:hypothetical protein